jgi:hypothetical protein
VAVSAVLAAFDTMRRTEGAAFDFTAALRQIVSPSGVNGWLQLVGIAAFAAVGGLCVAAWSAARGAAPKPDGAISEVRAP